jgi:hypothetical protein
MAWFVPCSRFLPISVRENAKPIQTKAPPKWRGLGIFSHIQALFLGALPAQNLPDPAKSYRTLNNHGGSLCRLNRSDMVAQQAISPALHDSGRTRPAVTISATAPWAVNSTKFFIH